MRIITTLALLALSMPASGQNATHESRGRWSTVTTEHYRLHYPRQAEAWAMEIAGQLDSIRERVAEEVGYMPTRTVDIVVMDPYRDSNCLLYTSPSPRD